MQTNDKEIRKMQIDEVFNFINTNRTLVQLLGEKKIDDLIHDITTGLEYSLYLIGTIAQQEQDKRKDW